MQPVKLNLKIYQGSSYSQVLRWESSTKVYKQITGIDKSGPVKIYSANHDIPLGWRVKVTDVAGMKEINSPEYKIVSAKSTDTIDINDINSLYFSNYTGGGVIEYKQPVNLAGYTAIMQIRAKQSSEDVILELTTENGGIVIDVIACTITLNITAEQTAELAFTTAVYALDVADTAGIVTTLSVGSVTLEKQITR